MRVALLAAALLGAASGASADEPTVGGPIGPVGARDEIALSFVAGAGAHARTRGDFAGARGFTVGSGGMAVDGARLRLSHLFGAEARSGIDFGAAADLGWAYASDRVGLFAPRGAVPAAGVAQPCVSTCTAQSLHIGVTQLTVVAAGTIAWSIPSRRLTLGLDGGAGVLWADARFHAWRDSYQGGSGTLLTRERYAGHDATWLPVLRAGLELAVQLAPKPPEGERGVRLAWRPGIRVRLEFLWAPRTAHLRFQGPGSVRYTASHGALALGAALVF